MTTTSKQGELFQPLGLFEFIFLLALLNSLTTFATDSLLTSQMAIGADFGVQNRVTLQYIIGIMFAGMALGEWFAGPLSDSYGRRPIMQSGLVIFAAGTLIVILAGTFNELLIGRFIQGLGMACVKITSRALIRDQYSGNEMGRIISFMVTILIFVPMIAPAVGEFMHHRYGWQSIAWLWLVGALIAISWFSVRQKESLLVVDRRPFKLGSIFSAAIKVILDPRLSGIILTLGCVWGIQVLYLANAKSIFTDIYKIDQNIGLYLGLLSTGLGIAAFVNGRIVTNYGTERIVKTALALMLVFCGLDLFIVLIEGYLPFNIFLFTTWGKLFCLGFIFGNLHAIGMMKLGNIAGLGATLMSAISSFYGVSFASFVGMFYDKSMLSILLGMFVLSFLALMTLHWSLSHHEKVIN